MNHTQEARVKSPGKTQRNHLPLYAFFPGSAISLPILPALLVLHVIAGLAFAPVNPLIDTVMQERLPAEMRARVFGTASAGVLVGIPLGAGVSGYVVAWAGLQMTLVIMGALYLVTTLSLLIHPALRQMEKGCR